MKKDIIVIGGSAGSGAVLKQLLNDLPAELPASVFITTHIPAHSPTMLAEVLAANSALPVVQAVDGQPIERGRVYVAVPDRHLLLIDGTIRLGMGPRENMCRPSIDPLFRSAALSYGSRVTGLILTGLLNDGAAGLQTVALAGGTTVVQHPLDAEADQMPLAALAAVDVDHVVSADKLAELLVAICNEDAGPTRPVSEDLRLEVGIAAGERVGVRSFSRSPLPARFPVLTATGYFPRSLAAAPCAIDARLVMPTRPSASWHILKKLTRPSESRCGSWRSGSRLLNGWRATPVNRGA